MKRGDVAEKIDEVTLVLGGESLVKLLTKDCVNGATAHPLLRWFFMKRRPRDPGPDREERERAKKPDPDDRTHAHHRHGGALLQDLDRDEPA